MARFDIFDTIEELRRTGEMFCVATVIRTADATSAKAGAKAAITRDGQIIGHLGGACVQRAVRAASGDALAAGAPQMIRVKPSDKVVNMTDSDGVQTYKSGCPSGGTVDLLIEPYEHPPRLAIFGDTPISRALAEHGALAGLRVMMAEGADAGAATVSRFDPAAAGAPGLEARDFVVVASQGKGDAVALAAALATPARRVSMVASRRKAEVLCEKLRGQGGDADAIARLKSPAGLDIHAIDPHEIAVSILAEIVQWRNTETAARNDSAQDNKLA